MAFLKVVDVAVCPSQEPIELGVTPSSEPITVSVNVLGGSCSEFTKWPVGSSPNLLATFFNLRNSYTRGSIVPAITVVVAGSVGPFSFTAVSLPEGLVLDTNTGTITGTITEPSPTKSIVIQATELETGHTVVTPTKSVDILGGD